LRQAPGPQIAVIGAALPAATEEVPR
jgi:hypothetical protein